MTKGALTTVSAPLSRALLLALREFLVQLA